MQFPKGIALALELRLIRILPLPVPERLYGAWSENPRENHILGTKEEKK